MNPLYQSNDSPNGSTQPTKAVNRESVHVPRTHNTFDNSFFHFKTQKFGQYEPFFVMEGVPGDTIPFSNSHNVRALPLSSPFLSSLKLNKDYFMVPNQAIQPNTWELLYKNPTQGDDCPDDAYNVFPLFTPVDGGSSFIDECFLKALIDQFLGKSVTPQSIWSLLILEMFFSSGCLLYQLGYKLNPVFIADDGIRMSFDDIFDSYFRAIGFEILLPNGQLFIVEGDERYKGLSLLRFYGSQAKITRIVFGSTVMFEDYSFDETSFPKYDSGSPDYINLDRLLAYQLACSQFYVNPNVDFIYNAQLYRDNLYSLYESAMLVGRLGFPQRRSFSYNGTDVLYDYASMKYYGEVNLQLLSHLISEEPSNDSMSAFFDYYNAIFGIRESLRFGDYFTDSRTRPLAIGDNIVPVTAEGVDVIDMSKSIIFQRFRNAAIKLGNNFGDYLRGIFHEDPSPDYHFPKFISHQDFDISGFEVSNTTSQNQGDLVTNLNSQDDTFVFQVDVSMPCVIIGISHFSVPRVYMQTKERHFLHRNRFDFFNPMLQYLGDQPVYNIERSDFYPNNEVFGYQSRYNEYKQRYSQASGGFVDILPAWTFVADPLFGSVTDRELSSVQDPVFIRAHDYEFNRFMSRIPGLSLGHGFHFIVVYNNKVVCNRPMEVNPNTL